jgi:hypothetical protein
MALSSRGGPLFPEKYSFLKYQKQFYEKGLRNVIFLSGNPVDNLKGGLNILGLTHTWDTENDKILDRE